MAVKPEWMAVCSGLLECQQLGIVKDHPSSSRRAKSEERSHLESVSSSPSNCKAERAQPWYLSVMTGGVRGRV